MDCFEREKSPIQKEEEKKKKHKITTIRNATLKHNRVFGKKNHFHDFYLTSPNKTKTYFIV